MSSSPETEPSLRYSMHSPSGFYEVVDEDFFSRITRELPSISTRRPSLSLSTHSESSNQSEKSLSLRYVTITYVQILNWLQCTKHQFFWGIACGFISNWPISTTLCILGPFYTNRNRGNHLVWLRPFKCVSSFFALGSTCSTAKSFCLEFPTRTLRRHPLGRWSFWRRPSHWIITRSQPYVWVRPITVSPMEWA